MYVELNPPGDVLLARGLPQLRADVHKKVHVGDVLEHVQKQDQGLGAVRREGVGPVGLVAWDPPDLAEDGVDLLAAEQPRVGGRISVDELYLVTSAKK